MNYILAFDGNNINREFKCRERKKKAHQKSQYTTQTNIANTKPTAKMEGVQYSHLDNLTSEIIMVDKSRLGIAYLHGLVRCSTGNVTTKKNKRQLPLEIWDQIVEEADELTEADTHLLMLPSMVQRMDVKEATITCEPIQPHQPCSKMASFEARDFEEYMASPREHICNEECEFHYYNTRDAITVPFATDENNRDTIYVPTVALLSTLKVLHHKLTIPDVTFWAEGDNFHGCRNYSRIETWFFLPGYDERGTFRQITVDEMGNCTENGQPFPGRSQTALEYRDMKRHMKKLLG